MTKMDKPKRKMHPKSLRNLQKGVTWKKGQSGNPSGKSRSHYDLVKKAKAAGPKAFKVILEVMENPKAPAALRVKCAIELLDRGFGKALNPLHLHAAVDVDHGQLHLEALKLVNQEVKLEALRQNGKAIEDKSYRAVTSDDKGEDATHE